MLAPYQRVRRSFSIRDPRAIMEALADLCAENEEQMMTAGLAGEDFPSVYDIGTYYRREEPGTEEWATAAKMLRDPESGYDCEDLACYQVAYYRVVRGEPARPVLKRSPSGWHVLLRRSDGLLEDPSIRLGMR